MSTGGPIVGGMIGGFFAVLAQQIANHTQRKRDQIADHDAVKATLKVIVAELLVYKKENLETVAAILKEREEVKQRGFDSGALAVMPLQSANRKMTSCGNKLSPSTVPEEHSWIS